MQPQTTEATKWTRVYQKPEASFQTNPFDASFWAWEVEAIDYGQALEKLEKNPNVPFRMWLSFLVPSNQLQAALSYYKIELQACWKIKDTHDSLLG